MDHLPVIEAIIKRIDSLVVEDDSYDMFDSGWNTALGEIRVFVKAVGSYTLRDPDQVQEPGAGS